MKKILLIEDDAVVAFVYRSGLEKEGFSVEVASDGASGLTRIQEDCPDVVILDLMLPKMSGLDVLKKVRALEKSCAIPVLVFTNAFIPMMVETAVQAGATKVFNKSEVTPRLLIDALKDVACFA